jgi:D-alanine-D-alanine ligase
MSRKNVAVLFGGRSVEHEISIITALQLINVLDVLRYRPVPVYVAQSGRWYAGDQLLNKEFYKKLPGSLSQVQEVTLLPIPKSGGLTVLKPKPSTLMNFFAKSDQVIPIDIYLLAFHGTFGEDGCIQGLLELADVAYTGSDVLSSAVAMNKYQCKMLLSAHGIPVLPAALIQRHEAKTSLSQVRERILSTPGLENFPLFVKPCNLGSSIGISVASDNQSLNAALVKTFRYDSQAIVEPCVKDILEVNVSVLEDKEPIASVVEIPVATAGVLTYEDKYLRESGTKAGSGSSGMAGLTRVIDPKDLNAELKQAAIQYSVDAFRILGCSGVARIDFIIDSSFDQIYFNEINSLPGSLAYYLWAKSNPPVLYTELLNRIIERAHMRQHTKASLRRDEGLRALFLS